MRIAFYAPMKHPDHPTPSGDRMVARMLIAAMQLAGHDVEVVCRFRSHDKRGDQNHQTRVEAAGRWLANALVARLALRPPDLWFTYHLYHKAPDFLGPTVSSALRLPYVVAEASFAPKQARGRWQRGHVAAAAAIAQANHLFGLSSADAACVRPLLANPQRLTTLRPFLDTASFAVAAQTFVPNSAVPRLLAVGMFRHGDKLDSYQILGAALSRLTHRQWRLAVCGYGPAEAEVRAALAPVSERIDWVGAVSREALIALYAQADLMVWPAINEAFGMALLEAQATGLPVVAGRVLGVPDIVRHGETGLLVPPGDVQAFAGAIAALLDDPAQRLRMRAQALATTASQHDISQAAQALDSGLRAACAEGPL
jgi:glycosyltransferase involved in cell wall biosynthesis